MGAVPLLVERASEPFRSNPLPQPRKGEPPRFIPPRLSWGFLVFCLQEYEQPRFFGSVFFAPFPFRHRQGLRNTYIRGSAPAHARWCADAREHLSTPVHNFSPK
jgi:hypothetical protein